MALQLPGASLTVNESALGIVPTPSTNVVVFIGVCQDGPASADPLSATYISKPKSFGNIPDLVSGRKNGPVVKAGAYHMARTGASIVMIRLPKTARAATKSAVDTSGLTDPTVAPSVSGTPNNQYDIRVRFPDGGTTGTGPISYEYSLDGGVNYSSAVSLDAGLVLGTAFTLATGLTVTLVTGKVITNDDFFSFTTTAASASVQPVVADIGASLTTSDVDTTGLTDPTVDPTVTGTPNNVYSIRIRFPLGGVTGTGPITYQYSLDGGTSYSANVSLGVGLTIGTAFTLATGLTIALVTGKTITTNDYFEFTTDMVSATTTSVVTVTGTPEDAYNGRLEVLTGCTIGTAGGIVRYSLDGGKTFTRPLNLLTASTLQINEYATDGTAYDSGLDFAFAAGDLTAGDVFTFTTTAPEAQDSDIVAGLEALKASALDWSFIHIVGTSNATTAGSVQTKLDTFANRAVYTWAGLSARRRGANELDETWRAELVDDVDGLSASRVAIGGGYRRITCAVTARRNFRPVMWFCVPRVAAGPLEDDPARVGAGPLSADVEISDDNDEITEHDARLNSDLHGARYVTVRTYEEIEGLYFTRGNMMALEGTDVSRIPLRRVLDLGSLIFRRVMVRQLENKVFVNGPTFPTVDRRGCIREVDARKIEREIRTALEAELTSQGRASAVSVAVGRTDPLLTNGGKITAKVRITPLAYIDLFEGDIAYLNPALADLTAA